MGTRPRDALAVEVAANMVRAHGAAALSFATERRTGAEAAGQIGRSDLYRAVCAIIADRDGVFSRSIPTPWRAGPDSGPV